MNEEELIKLLASANDVLQQGDKDKAMTLYEDIVGKDPHNAEAHMRLADLYAEKGMKEKASGELLLLGNAYYESRLFKNALKYFQKVLDLDPLQIDARIKAAEIYVNEEMDREAKLEYLAIAEHYLSANDLNKSEEFCKKAIDLKSIEAHYIMGLICYKRGMFKEAAASLETLTKIKVNHVGALIHLGFSQINNGKFTEAAAAFDRVLKAEPSNIDALKGITDAFARKGSSTDASGWYIKAIDAMLKANLADDAVKFALEYIKGSPSSADGYFKLAQVYEAKGKNADSAKNYKQAGDSYIKQRMDTKGKECLEKALQMEKLTSKPDVPLASKTEQAASAAPVAKPAQEFVIERTVPPPPPKPKADSMKQSFLDPAFVPPPATAKTVVMPPEPERPVVVNPAVVTESPKPVAKTPVNDNVTPLTEAKGDVTDLFQQAESHMKDAFFEKAIEIYRVILKKEPRNNTVRQKLHQAYLLLAQQEEEIGLKQESSAPTKKDAPKEKKSKISYL